MRRISLYRPVKVEESRPHCGLTRTDGKYRAEFLHGEQVGAYDAYIYAGNASVSSYAFFLVGSDGKEIALRNGWEHDTHASWDCIWGNSYRVYIRLFLGPDEISVTIKDFRDVRSTFVNLIFDITDRCRTISEARQYLEAIGANDPDGGASYRYICSPMQYLGETESAAVAVPDGMDCYSTEFASILLSRGDELFDAGEYERAENYYLTIFHFWPDLSKDHVCCRCGEIEDIKGNHDAASYYYGHAPGYEG